MIPACATMHRIMRQIVGPSSASAWAERISAHEIENSLPMGMTELHIIPYLEFLAVELIR